jgi:SAM-dependent methyltransferase
MPITNTMKNAKRSFNVFIHTTLLHKFLYLLGFIIAISLMVNCGRQQVEGFEEKTNDFKMNTQIPDIYGDLYVSLYDTLVFSKAKNDFEIGHLIQQTNPTEKTYILDVGSGTGHHISSYNAHGFDSIGVDISPTMIKESKKTYPDLKFQLGDIMNQRMFQDQSFTHISCFYFTIYYIKNKRQFFDNCMHWLKPGGFLALHLVNRDRFDPIIPAGNPFYIVSPQKYAKKRITNTIVHFDTVEYKSNFDIKNSVNSQDSPNAFLSETFKNKKNGNVTKNEHAFYLSTQSEVLNLAKEVGFIITSKIDMTKCQYDNQYIYFLQKPN